MVSYIESLPRSLLGVGRYRSGTFISISSPTNNSDAYRYEQTLSLILTEWISTQRPNPIYEDYGPSRPPVPGLAPDFSSMEESHASVYRANKVPVEVPQEQIFCSWLG